MPNPSIDSIAAATMRNYGKTYVDNVFSDRVLGNYLLRNDNLKLEDGGTSIVRQIEVAMNSTFGSYQGYDTLDITPQDPFSGVDVPWRQWAVSVAISGREEAINQSSPQRLFNLVEGKIKNSEETMKEKLNDLLYADGTGNDGKDPLGLAAVVSDSTAYGGINPATEGSEYWKSTIIDADDDEDDERSDAEWTRAFHSASRGNDRPQFIVTTQELFEHYEASLVDQKRFMNTSEADGRFVNLQFKNVPVYYDAACPEGTTYFLNAKYLYLVGMKGKWFKPSKFKEVPDKDAKWMNIFCMGNLICTNRQRQAAVINQTVVPTEEG